jgi:hypothetical protein
VLTAAVAGEAPDLSGEAAYVAASWVTFKQDIGTARPSRFRDCVETGAGETPAVHGSQADSRETQPPNQNGFTITMTTITIIRTVGISLTSR